MLIKQGFGRRSSWPIWRYYPYIPEKVKRTKEPLSQNFRYPAEIDTGYFLVSGANSLSST